MSSVGGVCNGDRVTVVFVVIVKGVEPGIGCQARAIVMSKVGIGRKRAFTTTEESERSEKGCELQIPLVPINLPRFGTAVTPKVRSFANRSGGTGT